MHGLINSAIQSFVWDGYGSRAWEESVVKAGLDFHQFETMLSYDNALTPRILDAVSEVLDRPRADLMEDIGTYLVSNPRLEAVRRLLRFGGVDFEDFLHSLDDLPDRARLAVSDLELPAMELREHAQGEFSLICGAPVAGFGHLMIGVLRAMADDYGALALLEHRGAKHGEETISVQLVATDFAEGRSFDLGQMAG